MTVEAYHTNVRTSIRLVQLIAGSSAKAYRTEVLISIQLWDYPCVKLAGEGPRLLFGEVGRR